MLYLPKAYIDDTREISGIEPSQLLTYELPYNLHENYSKNFNVFKNTLSAVINKIHVMLS